MIFFWHRLALVGAVRCLFKKSLPRESLMTDSWDIAAENAFSLLNTIGLERKSDPGLSDWSKLSAIFGISPTLSGIPVSPQLAISCIPFASAVKLISESMASLPMHVHKKAPSGGKQRFTDHPLHALLDDASSDLEKPLCFQVRAAGRLPVSQRYFRVHQSRRRKYRWADPSMQRPLSDDGLMIVRRGADKEDSVA
jgi:hypothetical protein